MKAVLFLLCVAPAMAFAATNTYTLDDCILIGLERSGAAANALRDQAIAATRVIQARATALPQLTLGANYTRLDETEELDVGGEVTDAGALDNYSAFAEFRQLLYSGGRISAALKAAGLSEEYALWVKAEVDSALVLEIREGFYAILLAGSEVEVREESVLHLERLVDQTRQRHARGTASEFELLNAQVRVGNETPALIAARNSYELGLAGFRRLLNLEQGPFAVDGELTYRPVELDFDDLLAAALENRASLRTMQALVGLREQDLRATRSEGLPRLDALFNYGGANAYRFVPYEDDWEWHWNAGVALEWNFWDSGLTRGRAAEKRLQLDKTRTDQEEHLKSVRLEVRQAFLEMQRAREAVEASRGNVELAERALEIARVRVDQGMATTLDFADANLQLGRARLTRLTAVQVHMSALARLLFATGLDEEFLYGEQKQ